MSDVNHDDFLSAETEKKVAEFEAKLKAEQAAMPDTSIRSGTAGMATLENYHFGNENIPIYSTGLNKQIDRVDMEVDRMRPRHPGRIRHYRRRRDEHVSRVSPGYARSASHLG